MTLELSRREVLKVAGGTVLGLGLSCGSSLDLGLKAGDSFDDVLDALHTTDPRWGGGLSNHGPMVAEALLAQGQTNRIVPWANEYASRLNRLDEAAPLSAVERPAALGHPGRLAGWIAAYEAELLDQSPRDVVLRSWATLSSGYVAAGLHGVLRTAHALRSLDREDTPSRRRELAHALGYWSATRRTLPGIPGAQPQVGLDVLQALHSVPMVPFRRRTRFGLIAERLAAVYDDPGFVPVIESVDLDALPIEQAATELTAAAARLFVSHGADSIVYLHAVTGSSALRLILPWLDDSAKRSGLGYAFQCVAAIHATQGSSVGVPVSVRAPRRTAAELAERVAREPDEHTIKLVEVALREHAVDPRPEFLAAADAWRP